MNEKMKIVFTGHVDHGKSTLIGRLLYNTKSIPEDKIKDMQYLSNGEQKIDFAFLMDHFEEERKQGITIDTAQIFFKTDKREYVIIDAPGHVEFIVNMITGASQADVAVLIVDASEGIREQTKRHAYLLSMLGIKQIILVVNKMDLVQYKRNLFDDIVLDLKSFLNKINIKDIVAVPISAVEGENVTERSKKMNWYQDLPLIEILDNLEITSEADAQNSLFTVQDIYNIDYGNEKQRLIIGRVENGEFLSGQKVYALPSGESTYIKSIEQYNYKCDKASSGECVGLTIRDPLFVERGNVLLELSKDAIVATRVEALVFWMSNDIGKIGEKINIKCSTQEQSCYIKQIKNKIDSATLKIINEDDFYINKLEISEVEICVKKPIVISTTIKVLSRFVLTKNDVIIASGIITGF